MGKTAAGDVAVNIRPCGCCPGCPVCEGWPRSSVGFTLAGIEITGCCPNILADPGVGFVLNDVADCLNRAWSLPWTMATFDPQPPDTTTCLDFYDQICTIHVDGLPFADDLVVAGHVVIKRTADIGTGDRSATVIANLSITFPGHLGTVGCDASVQYSHTFAWDDFDCAGPWVLEQDFNIPEFIGVSWPSTLTVTPSDDTPAAEIADCCTVTPEECGADTRYTCTDGTDCDESPTGEFATADDCAFFCHDGPIGVGTPIDGEGGSGDIVTDCCAVGGTTVGRTISIALSGAITAMWGLAWSPGLKAWVGSTIGCGQFLRAIFYCKTGEAAGYYFKLWCNDTLLFDGPVSMGEGDTACGPLSISFSLGTLTCGACGPGEVVVSLSDGGGGT